MVSWHYEPAVLDGKSPFGRRPISPLARITWIGATSRAIPRKWRKRIRKRFARRYPGPFDCTVEGINFRLYPAENHSDRVMAGRGELPEIPERRMIDELIVPGMTFVDIGANVGVYSLFIAKRTAANSTIVAFEPHPRTFSKLRFNCAANGFQDIHCINSGIGPQNEETVLFSDGGGNIGGASMLREAAGDTVSTAVRVGRLDDHLRGIGISRIDLLKIDIEGFEDQALLPFFDSQENKDLYPRAILLETVHRKLWRDDLMSRLESLGYRLESETAENVLLQR